MSSAIILGTGERLGIVGRIGITRQDNDLTKPDSTQNAFTTTTTLPDAKEVHKAMEHAAEGTSATRKPYTQLAATLETDGVELLPRALVQVQAYEPRVGYTVQLFGGNKTFYAALGDKKISDLNLDEFEHDWTAANIFLGLARPAASYPLGYCYDLIDRGKGDPAVWVPPTATAGGYYTLDPFAAELFPSVYVRALFERIVSEAGFSWRGSIPESFDRMVLPAVKAFGYSQATRDRYAVLAGWRYKYTDGGPRFTDDFEVPASATYTGADPFKVGDLAAFNASACSATIQIPGFYNIGVRHNIQLECNAFLNGKVKAILVLRLNGQILTTDEITTGDNASDTLEARYENIQLKAGDVVSATIKGEGIGTGPFNTGPFSPKWYWGAQAGPGPTEYFTYDAERFAFEVSLLEQFPPGGRLHLADWLPDLAQKDLVKFVTTTYALQQRPDPYLDVIEFEPVANLLGNLATAETWDGRLDNNRRPKVSYQFSGYAQKNWLRWKEDKANGDAAAGLGDAPLLCLDDTLDATRDLVKQPFAASPAGSNGLVLIPLYKVKVGSVPVDYDQQTPEPRVLLRSPTRSRVVYAVDGDKPIAGVGPATVPTAYFLADASIEPADLDFARTLAPTYYPVLSAALAAPRIIKPYVRLSPDDVVNFNQLEPVWLESEGSFFYKNKIEQYEEGASTTAVELIRILI